MMIDFESLPEGTVVFEQFPGVRFPGTPRVVVPTIGTASGEKALSNTHPGEEFNPQALVVEFLTPQQFVKLKAGLDCSSASPVEARLRAFDLSGTVVAEEGPASIGPGPTAITTEMQVEVEDERIVRIELQYSGAFAEVIDILEFSTTGPPAPPDTTAPTITIVQPSDGATLTGEWFIFEAEIIEDRKLRSVGLSISSDTGTESLELTTHDVGSLFRVGPANTGPLAMGTNTIVLTAEDFGGNVATASISVNRVPIEGTLVILAEEPIEIPRSPGSVPVWVELQETFPGSLDGRELVMIEVVSADHSLGRARLRDPLNDREPRLELNLTAHIWAALGPESLTVTATDEVSGRVLNSVTLTASITPATAVGCRGNKVAYYREIPLIDLTEGINARIDLDLSGDGKTVEAGDGDIGIPLVAFSPREKHTDSDGEGRFRVGDAVYADETDQGLVSVGDERLANALVGGNGSIVGQNAPDLGAALIAFAANERFADLNNNGQLDGGLVEPIYRDTDNSGNVSAGDVRLAKSLVVPDLLKLTPMTVQYLCDPYGDGLIRVRQKFVARRHTFEAEINFIAHLRVFLDPISVNADRIRFEYTFTHVRADPGLGPVFNPFIRGKFEDGFRNGFLGPFRAGLGPAIAARIRQEAEEAEIDPLLLLEEVYIDDREFGLGFCMPASKFPGGGGGG